ncbi:MAG TPA: methionine--tRNA ligase [Terriglobia bacterium]|jgi:methionyl-tRNA synthetase|nr:methionine--tRNA ligase [Terriglobia bacterium]
MKTFFLTTPIYYPNARPHVGSAYTTIVCDVIARYKRMCGYDVAFLTGTDEHGEKLQRAAEAAGVSPQEFVDEKRELFKELWEKLGISVKVYPAEPAPGKHALRFIYTTHPDHEQSVRRLLLRAKKNGYITKRLYEGRYCVSDERYISDGPEPANCDICGRPAELISEENWFFRLSAFQERLLELYDRHPEFVQPEYRRNEVKSFVKSGLRDISVSRKRIKWGFPFPLDENRNDPEQVVYVWYDALTSYMTGIGYAQGEKGSETFRKYWRNDDQGEIVHMIGKDILRFHAVYWPAFIMAAYPNQPEMLPTTVFAHGWIYYEQDKMSKSKGNVVYPEPIIDALNSFGAPGNDALRYYLLREAPFGQDTSFSYEGLIQRYNSDLANDLGNLASRIIAMITRYFRGEIPHFNHALTPSEEKMRFEFFGGTIKDGGVIASTTGGRTTDFQSFFKTFHFEIAVGYVWNLISAMNSYLVEQQPWKLAESGNAADRSLLSLILYTAADLLRTVTILLHPVLPNSSERLWKQLGCEGELKDQRFEHLRWGALKPGTKVGKPEPIFPRLDKAATLAKLDELAEADRERDKPKGVTIAVPSDEKPATSSQQPAPPSPQPAVPGSDRISLEDFARVEMRTGEVKAAERVPGATKLLKLLVDIGSEVRQVVAGIAEHYEPEKLIGMKVVIVTNLQPRKLRGIESNGMIVAASVEPDGRPVLVTFKEDVPNGARLK